MGAHLRDGAECGNDLIGTILCYHPLILQTASEGSQPCKEIDHG